MKMVINYKASDRSIMHSYSFIILFLPYVDNIKKSQLVGIYWHIISYDSYAILNTVYSIPYTVYVLKRKIHKTVDVLIFLDKSVILSEISNLFPYFCSDQDHSFADKNYYLHFSRHCRIFKILF